MQAKVADATLSESGEDNLSRIFVGGLSDEITEDCIREKFKRFGELTSIDIKVKEETGNRYAFVAIKAPAKKLTKCITTFNNTQWKDSILKLHLIKDDLTASVHKKKKASRLERSERLPDLGDLSSNKPSKTELSYSSRIFVGGLFENVTENEIRDKFQRFGEIISVDIKVREDTGSTFAFIVMNAPPSKVTKCITIFNNMIWNGSTLKLEIAKDSFLTRLQKERESRSKETEPQIPSDYISGSSNFQPLGSRKAIGSFANSLGEDRQINRDGEKYPLNASSSSARTPRFYEKSSKGRFGVDDFGEKVEPQSSLPKSAFLERLEIFSSAVWNDDHAYKRLPDDYDYEPVKSKKPKISQGSGPDGIAVKNNLTTTMNRKIIFDEDLSSELEPPKSNITEMEDKKSSMKHSLSNERRIKSIDERLTAMKLQQSLIKAALSNVDHRASKKRFFDGDEEPNNRDTLIANNEDELEEVKNVPSDRLRLFDDDDDFDEINKKDYDEEDADAFQIKPHFEGDAGHKLIALQSRYGNDARFNLDKRFAENDENDVEPIEDADQCDNERIRTFSVLENVLGYQLEAPKDGREKRSAKHWAETIPDRYDPGKEGHENYEIPNDQATDNENQFKNLSATARKKLRKENERLEKLKLPEVSAERFFHVEDNLQDAFKKGSQTGKFSLSDMFAEREGFPVEKENALTAPSDDPRTVWKVNPFIYDTSSDEEDDIEEHSDHEPEKTDAADSAITENDTFSFRLGRTFFISEDDPRLEEGGESFRRTEDIETIKVKWLSDKDYVIKTLKARISRLKAKESLKKRQKKPPKKKKGSAPSKFVGAKEWNIDGKRRAWMNKQRKNGKRIGVIICR